MLNNKEITEGFYWKEIGVFAIDPDTKEEVLFMYSTAGETSDYIPAFDENNMLERYVDVILYVSDVESIEATIDTSLVYVTQKDFDDLKKQIEEKIHNTIIVSEQEPTQDCVWYQVLRTRPHEEENNDENTVMLETTELDGTETYIAEIDNKEEKVINVDEELENNGNIIFEEV